MVRLKVARCKLQVNQRLRRPLHQALPAYAKHCQPTPRPLFLKRKPEVGGRQPEEGRMVQRGAVVVDTPLQKTVAVCLVALTQSVAVSRAWSRLVAGF